MVSWLFGLQVAAGILDVMLFHLALDTELPEECPHLAPLPVLPGLLFSFASFQAQGIPFFTVFKC